MAVRVLALTVGVGGIAVLSGMLFARAVRAGGVLMPTRVWQERTGESGVVVAIYVREGEHVSRGTRLACIDSGPLVVLLTQAENDLAARAVGRNAARVTQSQENDARFTRWTLAESRVLEAKAGFRDRLSLYGLPDNVDSMLRSYKRGSHVEMDRALSGVLVAESEQRSAAAGLRLPLPSRFEAERETLAMRDAESRLRALRERITRTCVIAQVDGVVLSEAPEQLIGRYLREGDEVLSLADTSLWEAKLLLNDADRARVQVGDSVSLLTDDHGNDDEVELRGVIRRIPLSPQLRGERSSEYTTQFEMRVQLASSDVKASRSRLYPGVRVQAHIVSSRDRFSARRWFAPLLR